MQLLAVCFDLSHAQTSITTYKLIRLCFQMVYVAKDIILY